MKRLLSPTSAVTSIFIETEKDETETSVWLMERRGWLQRNWVQL
jgi:hypothetical protein